MAEQPERGRRLRGLGPGQPHVGGREPEQRAEDDHRHERDQPGGDTVPGAAGQRRRGAPAPPLGVGRRSVGLGKHPAQQLERAHRISVPMTSLVKRRCVARSCRTRRQTRPTSRVARKKFPVTCNLFRGRGVYRGDGARCRAHHTGAEARTIATNVRASARVPAEPAHVVVPGADLRPSRGSISDAAESRRGRRYNPGRVEIPRPGRALATDSGFHGSGPGDGDGVCPAHLSLLPRSQPVDTQHNSAARTGPGGAVEVRAEG